MITEPVITLGGNLTADPELRYTPSGAAACAFSVASNPRIRNTAGEWEDGEPVYHRVTAWRALGENVAESLRRGDPVIVIGRVRANVWEDREGNKRRDNAIVADSVSVPLDRHRVRLVKVTRERGEAGSAESPAEPGPDAAAPATGGNGSAASTEPQEPATAVKPPASAGRSRRGRESA